MILILIFLSFFNLNAIDEKRLFIYYIFPSFRRSIFIDKFNSIKDKEEINEINSFSLEMKRFLKEIKDCSFNMEEDFEIENYPKKYHNSDNFISEDYLIKFNQLKNKRIFIYLKNFNDKNIFIPYLYHFKNLNKMRLNEYLKIKFFQDLKKDENRLNFILLPIF